MQGLKCTALLLLALATVAFAQNQAQLETPRLVQRDQRREFQPLAGEGSTFKFAFSKTTVKNDNAATLQLQVDKVFNPFLSTLSAPGMSQFMTLLRPCSVLLPHVHPTATEFYTILYGKMQAGIAQENGGLQNITFTVNPGEVFVAPRALLHFNLNAECDPLVFIQTFNNADAAALNVIGSLAQLGSPAGNPEALRSSNAGTITGSPQGAFALDSECQARCGLPAGGVGNGAPQGVPPEIAALFTGP